METQIKKTLIGSTLSFLGMAILATRALAGTAVAPGSGHPEGAHPWDSSNNNSAASLISDNRVCKTTGGNGNDIVWITPLAVPTSTSNRVTNITQTLSAVFGTSSQGWSFNPDGSAFMGIGQVDNSTVGALTVPPGGTAFVKTFLTGDAIDLGFGCIDTVTFD